MMFNVFMSNRKSSLESEEKHHNNFLYIYLLTCIKMDPWIKNLQEEVFDIIKEEVGNWGDIVNILVTNEEDRQEWIDDFKQQAREFFGDLIKDISDTQGKLLSNIEFLLQKASGLCKQLNMKMPQYGNGTATLGLYKEELELRKRIQELENEVSRRLKTVHEIKERQDVACKTLGRESIKIDENPLPTREQLDIISKHVVNLEEEIETRKEKYTFLKYEIITIADELQVEPSLEFERLVIYGDAEAFQVTDANMEMLEQFRLSLVQQTERVKAEILDLREKIKSLWEILSEDMYECEKFLESVNGNSLETLEILKKEYKRCDDLKKANLEVFIKKYRTEIEQYWDKCFFGEKQRNEFECFYDDLFTEDLLTLHDIQLEKIKKFYETNRELIDSIANYEKLWTKLYELDERASRPDRYKNRGGQLLKEEKERNSVEKRIPILEEKMLSLAAEYELNNSKPFLYKGEPLELKISKYQENYEQEKKSKLTALKHKRDITINTKSTSNLTKLVTPSKLGVSNFRTPSKRTALTPNFSANKKLKIAEKLTYKGTKTAPSKFQGAKNTPKIVVAPATPSTSLNNSKKGKNRVKLTYSTEKKKKARRSKRLSKVKHNLNLSTLKPAEENMNHDLNIPKPAGEDKNYLFFEADLSSKQTACRSTVYEPNIPKPYKATPYKRDLRLKNNNLSTAPVLKMEF